MILTDDQDIELNERLDSPLGPMRHTKTLMQQAGALGTHSYVNVPICCPSRSNILSGRYAHNIRDSHYEPFPPSGTDASGVPGHSCGDEPIEKVTCKAGTPKCLPCGCMRMNVSSLGEFPEQTYPVYLKRAGCESRSRPPIRAPQFVCCCPWQKPVPGFTVCGNPLPTSHEKCRQHRVLRQVFEPSRDDKVLPQRNSGPADWRLAYWMGHILWSDANRRIFRKRNSR